MSRNTLPIITKYELASLLSERAVEIANGNPITIQNPGTTDPIKIARLEFEAKKSPKKIIRMMPNGKKEVWSLSELRVLEI